MSLRRPLSISGDLSRSDEPALLPDGFGKARHQRRQRVLELATGGIFHADSPNGSSLICTVISISDAVILAKTVTTQRHLEFDRHSGVGEWGTRSILCIIDSIETLPTRVRNIILNIDRKPRLQQRPEWYRLTDAERQALVYVDSHYSLHRL